MKVTDHVEHLLREGRNPKELVELGFPKSVVTRVRRRLREEKAAPQTRIPQGSEEAKSYPQPSAASPVEMALMRQKLASLEGDLQKLESQVQALEARLSNTPTAGLKSRYKCDNCGSEGLLATYIKCTKCGTAHWWGWWPAK